jgi:putative copper export protein
MEHSLLHSLQLTGLIVVLGGCIFILGLLRPACRRLGPDPARETLAGALSAGVARWVAVGALIAAAATFLDLFVLAAETQNVTPFGGVELALVARLGLRTTVGQLALARIACFVLAAAATRAPAPGPGRWSIVAAVGAGALWCTALTSHAAAQPAARSLSIAAQLAHIAAGAAWLGVLAHLLAARATIIAHVRPSCLALIAEIVRRFSPVALSAASVLLVSGIYAAVRNLHAPAGLVTSAYGLTLLIKLVMVIPVLVAGVFNYRIVRPNLLRLAGAPALDVRGEGTAWLRRFGRMLELEVSAGMLVVIIAGILGSVSPPGEDGARLLTRVQLHALLTPTVPRATLVDPSSFVGAATRTVDDRRYAEFMHNWSGVFVTAMGLLWVAQGLGPLGATWVTRVWPFLLVPLALFISIFADPEVWVLRTVTLREAIVDPGIVEHQLGAALVLAMIWLGWRDQHRPPRERPLGAALPLVMIGGSVLLLGHAHTSARETEELGTLINVQHAALGGLGLLAGTVRWLSVRRIFPERPARVLWPLLVIAMGLYLTFCYRELT